MSFCRGVFALLLILFLLAGAARGEEAPHLAPKGDAIQLIVDGEPFLIRGGELGNSTASDLDYLAAHWETFEALNLNTVLATVSWELIEPQEGAFDFSLVDGLIEQARAHDQRLVLLWFGAWKNSMSSYAPAWVKRDQARFPRVRDAAGRPIEILTPFSEASRNADAAAFRALMAHLAKVDARRRTVLMVQVENEIGMLPEARDMSDLGEAAWAGDVPAALLDYLSAHEESLHPSVTGLWRKGATGTWAEVFGTSKAAEELFQAWGYARYVEHVAAAGLAEYDLPLFVNAALNRPGAEPGGYPSAGPLPQVLEIWRAGAPSIDFLSPDIYFPNFTHWMDQYDVPGNAFFIPEHNRTGRQETGAEALYAFGKLDAIGVSPFSIESAGAPEDETIDDVYALIGDMAPVILDHQGTDRMTAVKAPVDFEGRVDTADQQLRFGEYVFNIRFIDPWTAEEAQTPAAHGAIIIQLGPEEFYVAGRGVTLTFDHQEEGTAAGIESIWEGRFEKGAWRPGRLLNGDQSHQGRHLRLPPDGYGVQRLRLYSYR